MGVSRWLFNDWFTAHELDQVDQKLEQHNARMEAEADAAADAISGMRADIERLALLVHSLGELCLEHGVLTREQLRKRMLEIDLRDGVRDGRLGRSAGIGQVE